MNIIRNILFSNLAICFYEAVIIIILILYFRKLRKARKEALKMNELQKEKAREEKLDRALKNERYKDATQRSIPYEIDFHEEDVLDGRRGAAIAVQIEERNKLSTRKYMVYVKSAVGIGRGNDNALVVSDYAIARQQCQLFCYENELYIQTLEYTHPVIVCRGHNTMKLNKEAVKLRDKDEIMLGETRLKLHIV